MANSFLRSFNFNQADLQFILQQVEFRALFTKDASGNLVAVISGWDGTSAIYDQYGNSLFDPGSASAPKSYTVAQAQAMAKAAFAPYGQVYDKSGKPILSWNGSDAIYDAHGTQIWAGLGTFSGGAMDPALVVSIFGTSYGSSNSGSGVTDFAGLRNVSGRFNNLNPGQSHWGQVDGLFSHVAAPHKGGYLQEVLTGAATETATLSRASSVDGPVTQEHLGALTFDTFTRTTTTVTSTVSRADGHHLAVNHDVTATSTAISTQDFVNGLPADASTLVAPAVTVSVASLSGGELDAKYHPQLRAFDPTNPAAYVQNLARTSPGGAVDLTNPANTDYSVSFASPTSAPTMHSVIDYTPRMITQTTTQGGSPVNYLKVADATAITGDPLDKAWAGTGYAYNYEGGTGVVLLRDGNNHIVYWDSAEYRPDLVKFVEADITSNVHDATYYRGLATGTVLPGLDSHGNPITWDPTAYSYSKAIVDHHIQTPALIEGAPIVDTSVGLMAGQADGTGGVTGAGDANLYSGAGYGTLSIDGQHDKQNTDANSATGFGNHEYFDGNIASIAGNAPNNGWFALFGQFFDHGLDFINKSSTYQIVIPLAVDDPLYGVIGPDGQPTTSITINRAVVQGATQQIDPVTGQPMVDANGNPVLIAAYVNHDSPYIDQSQTYGSQADVDNILRNWVKDPNSGAWVMGDTLFDGKTSKAYTDAFGNTTTATLPTLNELRAEIRAHGGSDVGGARADLTWEDVSQGLRLRDANGAVITGAGAGTVEPLLLDNNPHYDQGHLTPAALAAVNAALDQAGLSFAHLSFDANGNLKGMTGTGLAALAPFMNFADFSIQSTLFGAPGQPAIGDTLHAALGEVMMEAVGDHYIAGDGRANENIGLTAIHHVFHEEHGYQVQNIETYILGLDKENNLPNGSDASHPHATAHDWQEAVAVKAGDVASAYVDGTSGVYLAKAGSVVARDADGNFYVTSAGQTASTYDHSHSFDGYVTDKDGNVLAADGSYTDASGMIAWDQNKMFNAAKMTVEMEYQHIAVDQYARAVSPNVQEFGGYASDRNADIGQEFSQAAFRFGHSTLRETIDTMDPTGGITGKIMSYALEQAFVDPALFSKIGAGAIALGMERQLMNEADNTITPSMNEGLLGQPMDLGAINLARGRDVGMPTLNEAKTALGLKAYADWADFGAQMIHPDQLANYIAAYSFDGDMTKAQTIVDLNAGVAPSALSADEQAFAQTLGTTYADQVAYASHFMNGGDKGIDKVDLWIGGLAEQHVAGGVLGETFDTIFVTQIENLMDGDRFYYLQRLVNQQFGNEIQNEQFKDLVERTTGNTHMNGNIFAYADQYYDEGKAAKVATADLNDPTKLGNLYAGSKSDGSWHQVFQVDATDPSGHTGHWLDSNGNVAADQTPVTGAIYDLWGQEVTDLFDAGGHKVFDRASMTWSDATYDPTASAVNADKVLYADRNTDPVTGLSPGSANPNFALVTLGADQHKYQQVIDAHAGDANHFGLEGVSDTGAVVLNESGNIGVGIWSVGGASTIANGQIQEHAYQLTLNDGADAYGNLPALLQPAGAIGGIDPRVNPTDHVTVDEKYILDVRPDGATINGDGSLDSGASSAEVLVGTKFNDYIELGIGDDTAYGDTGNDVIFGGKSNAGHNSIYGGEGSDFLFGGDAPDLIDGGKGDDWIWGNSSGASVGGMDQLIGGDGNDHVFGGIGIDKLFGGTGDDFMYGGQDTDPTFFGGDGNDYMQGGTGSDFMNGDAGDDIMDGGPGVDQLFGGAGDDILRPGPGVTSVGGNGGGADVLIGGDSQTNPDGTTTDSGFDFADYSQQTGNTGLVGDLANQALVSQLPKDKTPLPAGVQAATTNGDVWFEMEGIIGTKNADVLYGDSPVDVSAAVSHGDNWLIGGSGNDTFQGRGGNDVIVGGSIRLDTLIGKYVDPNGQADPYASYVDGASHRVEADAVLTGGLLKAASTGGITYDPHLTDLLKSEAYKNYFLGDGSPSGGVDTAVYTGKLANYKLTAIDANGVEVSNAHANWSSVAAIRITDNRTAADFVDANGNPLLDSTGNPLGNEGTDLVIGVQKFAFADQTIDIQAYYDKAPTLDLDYKAGPVTFASDNFNGFSAYGNGAGWIGSWTETGDVAANPPGTGAVQHGGNFFAGYLQFGQSAGAPNGAAISRMVDLSNHAAPTLTFDLSKNIGTSGSGDTLTLQYSSDGGAHFTTLATYSAVTTGGTKTVSLSAYQHTANSEIRFAVNHLGGASDYFRVDNVAISDIGDTHAGNDYAATYRERDPGVAIAAAPLITDPDDATNVSAKIVLRDGVAGDQLNLGALTGGIVASKVTATEIDLTGTASHAAYQAAIAAITFSDPTNHNPTAALRHIDVTVNDGFKDSNVATTTVQVTPVNDAPTAGADHVLTNVANGASFAVADWMLLANDTDPDSPSLRISGVTNQTSLTATHGFNATATTIADTGTLAGGSFDYTVSDGSATGTGHVVLDRVASTIIAGGAADDIVVAASGTTAVTAGDGNDVIVATVDNVRDQIDGGTGINTADYSAYSAGLAVDFTQAAALVGGSGATAATSDTLANVQSFIAGSGNDKVVAAADNIQNAFDGGLGNDTIDFSHHTAGLSVDLRTSAANAAGYATVLGSGADPAHSDLIKGFENVVGGGGADALTVGSATTTFTGGAGHDTLVFASVSQMKNGAARDAFTDFTSASVSGGTADQVDLRGLGALSLGHTGAALLWNGGGGEFLARSAAEVRYHVDATTQHLILDYHSAFANSTQADHQVDLGTTSKALVNADILHV